VRFFLALTHHPIEPPAGARSAPRTALGREENVNGSLVASSAGNPHGSVEAPIV
jgi:hypothetical protein